jgi:hypothetical protein
MAKALRADLVFSYWIYAWFILYACKYLKYSPKLALILGLLDNAIMLLLMMLFGTSVKTIFYFVIINTIIKVLPLYYLRKERITLKDVHFTCGLFLIFVVWLHINEQSLIGNIKIIHDSLLYGKNETPFMSFLSSIEKNYKNIQVL